MQSINGNQPITIKTTLTGGIKEVYRVVGLPNVPGGQLQPFDEVDMAFIDMLGAINQGQQAQEVKQAQTKSALNETKETNSSQTPSPSPSETTASTHETTPVYSEFPETIDAIQKDWQFFHDALNEVDVQYLKQVLVPGLPIAVGSVPLQSLIPVNSEGEFNFRGYEISSTLSKLIEHGYQTGRPVRIQMDEETSVILKIKNGRVSADFIANDRAMAVMIKQELDELKNRIAAKNLPVDHLGYRDHHKDQDDEYNHPFPKQFEDDEDDDMLFFL